MKRTYLGYILPLALVQVLAVWAVSGQPLFWDNVLLSGKIPTDLYQNHFNSLFVAENLAGYPPLWGLYLAQGWSWFGRSLASTHWLMLPWLWLIAYQLVRLAQEFVPRRVLGPTVLCLAFVPVLVSLSVQCGPDLALVGLYLAAQNAILARRRAWLSVWLVLLAMISPRGLWCLLPLFMIDQLLLGPKLFAPRWLWVFTKAFAYLPAALAAGFWYTLQYQHYGWLFNNPAGDFASLAEFTTLPEYLRQLGIAVWRMADMGQIVIWVPLAGFVWLWVKGRLEENVQRGALFLLTFAPAITFALFFAAFRNPIGHRYMLIPVLMGTLWLCAEWAEAFKYAKFRIRVVWMLAFFITGHFWAAAYPDSIAKGWDASLLHLQAGAAKADMRSSLAQLPAQDQAATGAAFPDADPWQDAFLDTIRFAPTIVDLSKNQYIVTSTASNDWQPATLDSLQRHGQVRISCTYWPIQMQLWRNHPTISHTTRR